MIKWLIGFLLLFCGDAVGAPDVQTQLEHTLQSTRTPGAAVALIENGTVQYFCGGNMSLDGKPVTEETLFEIGSITKVFTTLALMDLVEKGEVTLDDPIETFLPGLIVPHFKGKSITLRHLATHTSGLPRLPNNFFPKDLRNPYRDFTVERLYAFLESYKLRKEPGESFVYSNVGMGLLGHLLCLHTGKSYEALIHDLIEPLEMPNTIQVVKEDMTECFARGHQLGHEVSYWDLPCLAGAGALRSNIVDMTRFLAANMGEMSSPLNSLLRRCHERQCLATSEFAIGLGWLLSESEGSEVIWHNGATGGFTSYLGWNPETRKGVVILSNSTDNWPTLWGSLLLD